MSTVTMVITGLSMGITILVGERIGRGEPDEAGRAIGSGICLFAAFGVLLTVVLLAGAEPLARLLHAPEEAFAETVEYIRICGGGSLFIVAYNVLGAVFRGIGDARTPLFTVMLACVINIGGDGCFRMNMNEIATAVRCGKPLVQIILNNHVLGMVRQWQTLFYEQRYSQTILNDGVDFVKVSEAMGAKAIRVTKMEEVEPALKMALSSEGPVVLDCWIDQDLSVYPMVPAGASLDEVFDEEDVKK